MIKISDREFCMLVYACNRRTMPGSERDTFMDAPDPERWTEVAREDHEASGDTPAFSFITYERRA